LALDVSNNNDLVSDDREVSLPAIGVIVEHVVYRTEDLLYALILT